MAKLKINTKQLRSVTVCGEFCDWDIDTAIVADKKDGAKYIVVDDMPVGEYKIFTCKNFTSTEVYPSGRVMGNRYFSGLHDDIIDVYFADFLEVNNG